MERFSALFFPNGPRDQDCTIQTILVGIGVDIDAVVCGYLASVTENYRANCQKSAPSEISGVFGEVKRAIAGQSSKKTSTDWRRYIDTVTIQYIRALAEVWLAAWSLTMSNTARGGRQQQILGVLSELVGFHSRPYIDCVLLPHWLKMYQNAYMSAWAEQGLGCRFVLKRGVFIFVCEGR